MSEKITIHPLQIKLAFDKRMRKALVTSELTGEEILKFTKIFEEAFPNKLLSINGTA